MGKRYIDCSARELAAYHKKELLQSIADSEGRVIHAIREKLMPLPDETTVYTGHGDMTTIGTERMYNPYL